MLSEIVILPEFLQFIRETEKGRIENCSRRCTAVEAAWTGFLVARLRALPNVQALFWPVEPLE
jgi:hypothetical protein